MKVATAPQNLHSRKPQDWQQRQELAEKPTCFQMGRGRCPGRLSSPSTPSSLRRIPQSYSSKLHARGVHHLTSHTRNQNSLDTMRSKPGAPSRAASWGH